VLVNLEHLSTFEKRSHLSVIEEARLWIETEGEGASFHAQVLELSR
jgi:hypothetical protein